MFYLILLITLVILATYIPTYMYYCKLDKMYNSQRTDKQRRVYAILNGLVGNIFTIITIIMSIFGIVIVVSLSVIHGNQINEQIRLEQQYKILQYQIDNGFYENIVENGKSNLYNEVLSYNQKIIVGKEKHNDFIIGAGYFDIYEDLPLIELPEKDTN